MPSPFEAEHEIRIHVQVINWEYFLEKSSRKKDAELQRKKSQAKI